MADEVKDEPIKTKEEVEREMIATALTRNNGNRKKAADELGMTERTLYRRLKEYGLS